MGPSVDPKFIANIREYDALERLFVQLKCLEPKYLLVPNLSAVAHLEDFRIRFHPSNENFHEAIREVTDLWARIRPHVEAEQKAAEAENAEEKKEPPKDDLFDFELDTD
ncbi:hypothetical protein A3K87_09950 [Variovorax paradoxus]|uniref:Uncharacterized protein n=1 Tax=Variovorax paradoxus TaxID=34073 RepID=A0AA91DRC2_VARPD|nr:hypothetical protein [Variovorax paradoxus]OAK66078.1 hypothetical protein A3K87_09950 [Variovorax paradoxus]